MVESTEAELIKLRDKLVGFGDASDVTLDRLILEVTNERERLAAISSTVNGDTTFELGMESRLGLMQLQQRIKEKLTELTKRHRELHTTVSRVGKHIDKGFVSLERNGLPLGRATDPTEGASRDLLNRALAEHLLREGAAETAAELCREANILFEADQADKYASLQLVVEALTRRDLSPAKEWVKINRDALHAKESSIEFQLAKLQFIEAARCAGVGTEEQVALVRQHARHLAHFSPRADADLQRLMGGLAFARRGLADSPYGDLLDHALWHELREAFVREANTLLGFSSQSALSIAFEAGCRALPPLHTIQQVMQQRQVHMNLAGELPIEVDLGVLGRRQHHSIFACPILRQQSTGSNPPVRLICGHAISMDAVKKLSNNGTKLKCPYCPTEMDLSQTLIIHF